MFGLGRRGEGWGWSGVLEEKRNQGGMSASLVLGPGNKAT